MTDRLSITPLADYLAQIRSPDQPATDDVIGVLLPLIKQVKATHETGEVAPLLGIANIAVSAGQAWFESGKAIPPRDNLAVIERLQKPASTAIKIVEQLDLTQDFTEFALELASADVAPQSDRIDKPVYLSGYVAWEQVLNHHDELTDVYVLGLLLGSLALGLDLTEQADVERFVRNRDNLYRLVPTLDPVLEKAIVQTTRLNRHERLQDLSVLINRLENYRDLPTDTPLDFNSEAFQEAPLATRRQLILSRLRDRLFEISKRNRLIYFKPTQSTVDLTEASVPMLLSFENIRPEHLFTWNDDIRSHVIKSKEIALKRYLRFEEHPYLSGTLDKVRSQANKDLKEFGFSQLHLVLCLFRWHNLKEEAQVRIDSPLLLLPVELEKKRGIRDSYLLRPTATVAEVNPALRFHLKQLYNLDLPEAVDLEQTTMDEFHSILESMIKASEPGIDLQKIDKPRIDLIHSRAVKRLDQYRRRSRLTGRGIRQFQDLDYSYSATNYQPLGLQLFLRRVRPAPIPFHDVFSPPKPRPIQMAAKSAEASRTQYSLRKGTDNPYTWEFDLCSMTIGNFNYRKMTLVRDYTNLISGDQVTPSFDQLFSLEPKSIEPDGTPDPALADSYHVVDCDPSQARAIAASSERESLIIQGPPGTGKSQTITNLIADYSARGKRVLFICEKRAAIDVVYFRLKQKGLHHLCCLIHDSQTDKKSFIMDLKARYEAFITREPPTDSWQARSELIAEAERILDVLNTHSAALHRIDASYGVDAQTLFRRLVALADHLPELSASDEESMPFYAAWQDHGSTVLRIHQALSHLGHSYLCEHPLSVIEGELFRDRHPIKAISERLARAKELLDAMAPAIAALPLPAEYSQHSAELAELCELAVKLGAFAEHKLLDLLDDESSDAREFDASLRESEAKQAALAEAAEHCTHWRERLPADETNIALEQARDCEGIFAFLKPSFWRLRKVLRSRYDFASHAIKPSWTKILGDLAAEHAAAKSLSSHREALRERCQCGDLNAFAAQICELRNTVANSAAHALFCELRNGQDLIPPLLGLRPQICELRSTLQSLLRRGDMAFEEIRETLSAIDQQISQVPYIASIFEELASVSSELRDVLLSQALGPDAIEAAIAHRTLADACRRDRSLTALPMKEIDRHLERLRSIHRQLLDLNALSVLSNIVNTFRRNLQISSVPASQLQEDEKPLKKAYAAGRRDLEREFNKTMRYRAIREMAEGDSGRVIKDLKPVWLMSPVSVADTLPLDPELFDVVIFDEASQIPIEEAIPAIFRAQKMIVVGDEMQLPPSAFFASKASPEDEEGDNNPLQELETDSFLSMASNQLPTTMLGWHYRSRSESLISFSNACFYKGELLTIPDRSVPQADRPAIVANSPSDAATYLPDVLSRSISFHRMANGVYNKRRNSVEAAYIAELVRSMLAQDIGRSIGIVAFSEAQQQAIESALTALAQDDSDFHEQLEREYEREVDEQFCGLFVKNLENVQGDERDIIILSICYGPDPNGRMLMNFGPINQNGGEKRLNVIFSRAKHHMVLVSSISYAAITNIYNDGANCFRRYLEYAQAISEGRFAAAERVLSSMQLAGQPERQQDTPETDPIVSGLASALEEAGYDCATNVGQSDFVCDLAVGEPGASAYQLGILVDTAQFYANENAMERYLLKPELLRAFGWRILMVKSSDWYEEKEQVLDHILRELRSPSDAPDEELANLAASAYGDLDAESAAPPRKKNGKTEKIDYEQIIAEHITVTENVEISAEVADLRDELISKFEDLSTWVKGEFKQAAYRNAARLVSGLTEEELRSRVSFLDIKGIGKTTNEIISEYRRSGHMPLWEQEEERRKAEG
ncbi:MAG: hypothetical protein ACI8W8_002629 [Rhodothermales bacterium]|jgi:hypothetical protein